MKRFQVYDHTYSGKYPIQIQPFYHSFKGLDNGICIILKCRNPFKHGYYLPSRCMVLIRPVNERDGKLVSVILMLPVTVIAFGIGVLFGRKF